MFSLIRLSRNKLPACIAIIAILLLFVAPEVSKTLEHRRMENHNEQPATPDADNMHSVHDADSSSNVDDMSGMMEGMAMSSAEMPLHHDMPPHAQQPSPMPGMAGMMSGSMMDDIACNYCVMLLHLPLMLWIFVAIIWLIIRVANAPPPRLILPTFTLFFPGTAQPRAPPVN
ncbi:hypothetical protein NG99_17760 [Erwinia typographi]|uniref:DUF2946 domain-containing protein n=1 Tax=Erwinia typographi TaxID=371042 RepID=A0A0A3YVB7_9GAMM|nr:DUF2946 domain-containing protein [Erwinia typographi]KGT90525.1 hypothetical protein NG99_17760 [Erwinia typographi]